MPDIKISVRTSSTSSKRSTTTSRSKKKKKDKKCEKKKPKHENCQVTSSSSVEDNDELTKNKRVPPTPLLTINNSKKYERRLSRESVLDDNVTNLSNSSKGSYYGVFHKFRDYYKKETKVDVNEDEIEQNKEELEPWGVRLDDDNYDYENTLEEYLGLGDEDKYSSSKTNKDKKAGNDYFTYTSVKKSDENSTKNKIFQCVDLNKKDMKLCKKNGTTRYQYNVNSSYGKFQSLRERLNCCGGVVPNASPNEIISDVRELFNVVSRRNKSQRRVRFSPIDLIHSYSERQRLGSYSVEEEDSLTESSYQGQSYDNNDQVNFNWLGGLSMTNVMKDVSDVISMRKKESDRDSDISSILSNQEEKETTDEDIPTYDPPVNYSILKEGFDTTNKESSSNNRQLVNYCQENGLTLVPDVDSFVLIMPNSQQ